MPTDKNDFEKRRAAVRKLDIKGAIAGFLDEAQRLVEDFPMHGASWMELGVALGHVARYDEALKALNKCGRLRKPKYLPLTYALKGNLFKAKGNYRLAEQWYRRAIELQPRDGNYWALLGEVLVNQGRLSEAKEVWRKQIELGSGATEEGHLHLGYIYRAEQKYEIAIRHAEKAIAIDPNYKEAKLLRTDLIRAIKWGS
jgi:tetratricopeptide (TPR) repeat protein